MPLLQQRKLVIPFHPDFHNEIMYARNVFEDNSLESLRSSEKHLRRMDLQI